MSSLEKIVWPYEIIRRSLDDIECPKCKSQLVKFIGPETQYPHIDLMCHSCGEKFEYQDAMSEHLYKIYFADAYIAMTQGGEPPIEECISCNFETFIVDENLCVNCGYQHKYAVCLRCGDDICLRAEGIDPPKICDYCDHLESMLYKD
jgi:hypothetical protein